MNEMKNCINLIEKLFFVERKPFPNRIITTECLNNIELDLSGYSHPGDLRKILIEKHKKLEIEHTKYDREPYSYICDSKEYMGISFPLSVTSTQIKEKTLRMAWDSLGINNDPPSIIEKPILKTGKNGLCSKGCFGFDGYCRFKLGYCISEGTIPDKKCPLYKTKNGLLNLGEQK